MILYKINQNRSHLAIRWVISLALILSSPGFVMAAVVGPQISEGKQQSYSEEEIASLSASAQEIVEEARATAWGSRNRAFGKQIEGDDEFEAPPSTRSSRSSGAMSLDEIAKEYGFSPDTTAQAKAKKKKGTQMGLVRMWGSYRLAAGVDDDDFILNESNSVNAIHTLQGPQSDYIFGEHRENTFDAGIYNQYKLNLDVTPRDKWDFYTQIVLDPWSWVGTTGEQVQRSNTDSVAQLRYNLKYFGAFNSTIRETYRDNRANIISFPYVEVDDGHLVRGSQGRVTSGILDRRYNVHELDVDMEFRPFRKVWLDYKEDDWYVRAFALAGEEQALSTDDPLQLSNHRDYWQQSPWLYQYKPVQHFFDRSLERGHYSDALSYYARDSEGNRLVLLRGFAYEGDFDKTYVASTIAAPHTPWGEYDAADNFLGATRVKHQMNERWMLGGTHTYRVGLIDNSPADSNRVWSVDTKIAMTDHVDFVAQFAQSYREYDLKTNERTIRNRKGIAVKAEFQGDYDHKHDDGHTEWQLSYAQMDRGFQPLNSQYLNTRDDRFWGTHISFDEHPDLEPFKLGDGLDVNRLVTRFHWKEKLFKDRFYNEFDIRNVHKREGTRYVDTGPVIDQWSDMDTTYVETVTRNELTLKLNPRVTFKGLFRWRALPKTMENIDPIFTGYYFPKDDIDLNDFYIFNDDIRRGRNADQFTYSGALQYNVDSNLTLEGIYERTNNIPDFPRGLLNDFFRNPVDRVQGVLEDRVQNFMYFQGGVLKGAAPYPFYNIFKERVIYRPESRVTYTFHATQNQYLPAGGIDDNVNHVGLGINFVQSKKLNWFCDYTFSHHIDVPRYIDTSEAVAEPNDHHNFYVSFDYNLTKATLLRGEYGVFGLDANNAGNPYNAGVFSLPTVDTEHLFRLSLAGEF